MKVFIDNINWADEGDIFCFSLIEEDKLKALKDLIEASGNTLDSIEITLYWGTNECLDFDCCDILNLIDQAKDISQEELAVFNKFKVEGLDVYNKIIDTIPEIISELLLDDKDINKLKKPFIKLYSEQDWKNLELD